ncbi:MAG TPA: TIM44-like domain-containing protein [Kofleriaceae bacterium]
MPIHIILAITLVLAVAGVAEARPGGGDTYSGGGGHDSGGGGGGGDAGAIFELLYWLLRLAIHYPQIGLPLIGIVVGWVLYSAYKQHQNKDWDSGPPVPLARAIDLGRVRRFDPDFSQVVFEDFAYRLFSTAHRARSSAEALATIAPYVAPAARAALAAREPKGVPVQQVIVGAMRVFRCDVPETQRDTLDRPTRVRIGIEFEANVATAQATYYSVESWLFGRDATQTSKPPSPARGFPCPNCGAPWQASATGTQQCANCGQVVDNGRFDWVVEQVSLSAIDERPPTLTTEVQERGTDLPTYVQTNARQHLAELQRDDPEVEENVLKARTQLIYAALTDAWTKNELVPVRGFVSDGLYDYLSYWVDAYKRQGLRNALVDMHVTKTELAKVSRDRWYDAVTFRLWATGKDYVVRGNDVVRGSTRRDRPYSEYWTLIRSAERKGPTKTSASCGNCGAPLEVSMAGACNYCGAHVTAGEFDWVLSKIEQDDSYRG